MSKEDSQLDDFQRMAQQTHPQLLPAAVDRLASEVQRAESDYNLHADMLSKRQNRLKAALGGTALATVTTQISIETLSVLQRGELSWGRANTAFLAFGMFSASVRGLAHILGNQSWSQRARASRERYQHLGGLHNIARNRALEMGLLESET